MNAIQLDKRTQTTTNTSTLTNTVKGVEELSELHISLTILSQI